MVQNGAFAVKSTNRDLADTKTAKNWIKWHISSKTQ